MTAITAHHPQLCVVLAHMAQVLGGIIIHQLRVRASIVSFPEAPWPHHRRSGFLLLATRPSIQNALILIDRPQISSRIVQILVDVGAVVWTLGAVSHIVGSEERHIQAGYKRGVSEQCAKDRMHVLVLSHGPRKLTSLKPTFDGTSSTASWVHTN